jgi:hypothetical protein
MVELLVAAAVFLVISGASLALISQHLPIFNQQQNLAALNIVMRNAAAQIQIDMVNAGSGYYTGINIPNWPVGVIPSNNVVATGADCHNSTTYVYGASCFDSLSIIASDPSTPPSHPTDNGSNCVSTTSSILFANPVAPTTLSQLAADFHDGDQIFLLKGNGSGIMTTTILSRDGQVTGGKVQLQHNPTASDGSNSSANDPLGITTHLNNQLGIAFCSGDWILKLAPITYSVDTSTPTNPKLTRSRGGTTSVLAEQIIGFKVGATLFNDSTDTDTPTYQFDSSNYSLSGTSFAYNYTVIRSVMISLIGRTPPVTDPTYVFRNSFDSGPYEIQGVSVVVNPRNMSMTD